MTQGNRLSVLVCLALKPFTLKIYSFFGSFFTVSNPVGDIVFINKDIGPYYLCTFLS